MKKIIGAIGLILLVGVGCTGGKQASPSTPAAVNSVLEQTNEQAAAVEQVLTQEFAKTLVCKDWGGCDPSDSCKKMTVTVVDQHYYGQYTVTSIQEGCQDDSMEAEKRVATAAYGDGGWVLWKPTVTYRCQPGRGQQDFSPDPCR